MTRDKSSTGRIYTRKTLPEKFESHIVRGAADECWDWQAAKYSNGYGHLRHEDKDLLTHRLAWELFKGPIPEGILVLHRCDRPACVNYERHLFLGTHADNSRDMVSKQRHPSAQPGFVARPTFRECCKNGHPLTPDNVSYTNHGKARRCTICYTASSRAGYLRNYTKGVGWKHLSI